MSFITLAQRLRDYVKSLVDKGTSDTNQLESARIELETAYSKILVLTDERDKAVNNEKYALDLAVDYQASYAQVKAKLAESEAKIAELELTIAEDAKSDADFYAAVDAILPVVEVVPE